MPDFAEVRPSSTVPRWALAAGLLVFVAGLVISVRSVDVGLEDVSIVLLVVAGLVGVPVMTILNALEYRLTARLNGHDVNLRDAVEVAVTSTAANLLPLPGGPLVKIASLKRAGSSAGSAAKATLWTGLLWLATATAVGATALAAGGRPAYVIVTGVSIAAAAFSLLRLNRHNQAPRPHSALLGLTAVELGATVATALRLWLIAEAVGASIGSTAFVLSLAPVLGAAVVFVPSGWGIREATSAALALISGTAASIGYLISAIDRILGLIVHGSAAAYLLTRRDRLLVT